MTEEINEEGITAILGLVLLTQENQEVRISDELILKGLPENSGVQVYHDDDEAGVLVVKIEEYK